MTITIHFKIYRFGFGTFHGLRPSPNFQFHTMKLSLTKRIRLKIVIMIKMDN